MQDKAHAYRDVFGFLAAWWFTPLFIVGGQVLMRLTGYTAWAEQAGQAFMLTMIFYLALLGPLLGGRCLWLLARPSEGGMPRQG